MEGWIKLHRQMLEWEWYKDINTFKVFVHLLLTAYTKDIKYMGQIVPRGSLVVKEKTLGEEVGLEYQEVRTAFKKLLKTNEITKKSTNKFTLINIVNYELYQGVTLNEQRTTNEQLTTNQRTINELSTSIEEEEKKERIKEKNKKDSSSKKVFDVDSSEMVIVKYFVDRLLKIKPEMKVPKTNEQLNSWCKHIDYMLRLDKRDKIEISKVIKWVTSDPFWSKNILSTSSLREKYDRLYLSMINNKDKPDKQGISEADITRQKFMARKKLEEEEYLEKLKRGERIR